LCFGGEERERERERRRGVVGCGMSEEVGSGLRETHKERGEVCVGSFTQQVFY
jgi:hypothetical protein